MKRPWVILVAGLLLGAATYFLVASRHLKRSAAPENATALAWMQHEFGLSDQAFTRVCEMHREYAPHCREMCGRIDLQNARLQELLLSTNRVTVEMEATLQELSTLRARCQAMMIEHFYRVSQVMPPDQGKRYLLWVQNETLFAGQHPVMIQ